MPNNRFLSNRIEYKEIRKNLRNRSTSAESTLWNLLKNKKIDGRKFRRQHSIKYYIVDFYCSSEKLIIELDGNPHGEHIQIQRDEVRDTYFLENGYRVIRFENKWVFQDPEFVIRTIREVFLNET